MGRSKLEVRKIEDKNKRMATFRKRRDGLFKKALEIHLLTGADVYLSIVNSDKQYRLNRLSDAATNPHLVVMEYTTQGSFQKSFSRPHVSPDGQLNSHISVRESEDLCSVVSSDSEAATATEMPSPVHSRRAQTQTHGISTEVVGVMRRYLEHILADWLFKKELKRFATTTQKCLQESSNLSSKAVCSTSFPQTDWNLRPADVMDEPVLERSKLLSNGTPAPSYLQPVSVWSATDLDDSMFTPNFPGELVSNVNDAHLPTDSSPLSDRSTKPGQSLTRPTALSFRYSTNESQFISPMSEYIEFINNDIRETVSRDLPAFGIGSDGVSLGPSSTSPSASSFSEASPLPTTTHELLPTVEDICRELFAYDGSIVSNDTISQVIS
ncbi:hypothetical protein D915_007545 [Fasciola hepatica]|uniref:MADS-box domain-containing protein n=1 Tax=Fasciola hepatica TaxID=6192 RepID=A0A4E0RVK8_FASHE|nr:hypothetical protein D915_007545 [Fasciola hepatica]